MGIQAAVSRRTETGALVAPEERITPVDALRMYTEEGAWAGFEESNIGSITPGKLADMVLLSADPTNIAPDEIKDIKVEMTIINGEVVWSRGIPQGQ